MSNITISQALRRIKKLKGEIAEHQSRAASASCWTKDKTPSYDFNMEVQKLSDCKNGMLDLESRVAVANATNTVNLGGVDLTLAALIRHLQEIKSEIAWLKSLTLRSGTEKSRESEWDDNLSKTVIRTTETVWVSVMTEQERNIKVKALQDRFEELNNILEDANHSVFI